LDGAENENVSGLNMRKDCTIKKVPFDKVRKVN